MNYRGDIMETNNMIKYVILNNEDNIKKIAEKGYIPFYNRQTGKLEGYEFKKNNILGADCNVNFVYDEENDKFVLDDLTTIYGKKDTNLIIADALLSLALDGILTKEEITNDETGPDSEEKGDENESL